MVLPDINGSQPIEAAFSICEPQIMRYESGRPWIVGRWSNEMMMLTQVESARIAIFGQFLTDPVQLASSSLAGVSRVSDLDRVICELPGSFHIVSTIAGQVRVQGTISALRQVSYIRINGITVAADSSYVLASLAGAAIDWNVVALRLASPQLPYLLDDKPMWHGVHIVPPDSYLVIDREAPPRVRRWWYPPEPTLSLAEGAARVRHALVSAVALRTAGHNSISTDLSGGMDSTSLCFLIAAETEQLLTVRRVEADPGSQDDRWGRYVADGLPNAKHLVFTHNETPTIYSAVRDVMKEHVDEPYRWIRTWGRHQHLATILAEHSRSLHFAGHGGDELFGTFPSYLHTLTRVNPRVAARHLQGFCALRQWSWQDTARALTDRATFPNWLENVAEQLNVPPPNSAKPHLSWGWPVRMPAWATSAAVKAAQYLIRGMARRMPAALASQRAQHEVLQYTRACGRAVRQLSALMDQSGTQLAAPYLDNRVIEAALSVRLDERMTPWRYKPLLAAAMSGLVPSEVLGRTTKGDFTADVYAGLKLNRGDLLDLFADSMLAQHGLVNPDILRKAILGLHPTFSTLIPLEQTISCEMWLRAVNTPRSLIQIREPRCH